MATILQCQPSTGEANQNLVIAIRVLAAVGLSYLLRFLYQLVSQSLFSHHSLSGRTDASTEENIGITPNPTAPASRAVLELDFDAYSFDGGDLGIRMPEPAYHPRGRL